MKRWFRSGLAVIAVLCMMAVSGAGIDISYAVTEQKAALQVTGTEELPDQAELLEQYLMNTAKANLEYGQFQVKKTPMLSKNPGRAKLSTREQLAYDYLKEEIRKIAAGEKSSTVIEIPSSVFLEKSKYTIKELGFTDNYNGKDQVQLVYNAIGLSASKILDALLMDVPYELYWYDKTIGCGCRDFGQNGDYYLLNDSILVPDEVGMTFQFTVSEDYSVNATRGQTSADTSKTGAATAAAELAASLVKEAASKSDYDKLKYYQEQIIGMVDYNDEAAYSESIAYGDPWQVVYVFDGDDSTNVVCEGYSKAFKYLCDLSAFSSNIVEAYLATGRTEYGPHMWNLVRMNDDKIYHVDLTNCDEGSAGYPDLLFLTGKTSGDATAYRVTFQTQWGNGELNYKYNEDMLSVYSEKERTVSDSDYLVGTESNSQAEQAEKDLADADSKMIKEHGLNRAANDVTVKIEKLLSQINSFNTNDDTAFAQMQNRVKEVRAEYDGLADEIKERISSETVANLEAAEKKIAEIAEQRNNKSDVIEYYLYGTLYGKKVYTYDGRVKNPMPGAFIVTKDGSGDARTELVQGIDYRVSWLTDRKSIGRHRLRINFIGRFSIFKPITYTFTIKPAKAAISKAGAGRKKASLTLKKQNGGVRYQVQYRIGRGKWKSKTASGRKLTIRKLKSGKRYTFRARTYKKVNGVTYYGAWSKAKRVKIK